MNGHIWRSLCQSLSLLCPYMEIPDVINIKPISGNAHIWTYCVSLMTTSVVAATRVTLANEFRPCPFYAHIWRSLMSSILSPYLGMPIYGHTVSVSCGLWRQTSMMSVISISGKSLKSMEKINSLIHLYKLNYATYLLAKWKQTSPDEAVRFDIWPNCGPPKLWEE